MHMDTMYGLGSEIQSHVRMGAIDPSYTASKCALQRNNFQTSRGSMELYQLRSFLAVAEAGNLTRAAEKLHLSQPALSAQIRSLEDELEVTLFERTSGGMTPTAAGRRLL